MIDLNLTIKTLNTIVILTTMTVQLLIQPIFHNKSHVKIFQNLQILLKIKLILKIIQNIITKNIKIKKMYFLQVKKTVFLFSHLQIIKILMAIYSKNDLINHIIIFLNQIFHKINNKIKFFNKNENKIK